MSLRETLLMSFVSQLTNNLNMLGPAQIVATCVHAYPWVARNLLTVLFVTWLPGIPLRLPNHP